MIVAADKVTWPVDGVNVAPEVMLNGVLPDIVVAAEPIFRVPPDATVKDVAVATDDPIVTVPPDDMDTAPKDTVDAFNFTEALEFTVKLPELSKV